MNPSPFIYGKTVSQTAFTNREEEVQKLYQNLTQNINTILIAPRRWGKSSLVEKVVHKINQKEKKSKTVVIDLFTVSSEEEFLEVFAREVIKASSSRWQEWMQSTRDFFKQLIPKIAIGIEPTSDFSLSFDWQELRKYADEVLNLPQKIAEKKNIHFIIGLDEFQQLAEFKTYESFERKMRAAWQRQTHVTYCLYGSKRHMMTALFDTPSKPFYRFGDIMLLPKIKPDKWVSFIRKSFKRTGKKITPVLARKIPEIMKNHSWYVQQLAHYTWQRTNDEVTDNLLESALAELIQSNTPLYQMEVEVLSKTQLNLLKAMSAGETKLTSGRVMKTYRLGTPRNVSKNRAVLIKKDLVYAEKNTWAFLDPAFEIWFKSVFD